MGSLRYVQERVRPFNYCCSMHTRSIKTHKHINNNDNNISKYNNNAFIDRCSAVAQQVKSISSIENTETSIQRSGERLKRKILIHRAPDSPRNIGRTYGMKSIANVDLKKIF